MDRRSQGLVGAAHAVAALPRAHRHRPPARRPRSRGHLAHWPQRGTARLARRGRWRRGRARDGRAGERVDRRAPRGGARQRRAHRGPQRHRRASCRALRRARARRGCRCRRRSEGEPARSRRVPRRAGRALVARARCRARRHADDGVVDRRRASTCRARRRHPRSALCRGSRARRELHPRLRVRSPRGAPACGDEGPHGGHLGRRSRRRPAGARAACDARAGPAARRRVARRRRSTRRRSTRRAAAARQRSRQRRSARRRSA